MRSLRHQRLAALTVALLACVACQDASEDTGSTSSATSLGQILSNIVQNGAFTNMYVFQENFPGETWDQHIASLRPTDASSFTRASIDAVSDFNMNGAWPSYWDPAWQYHCGFSTDCGIAPPQFFGSGMATQSCVQAMLADLDNGVVDWRTAGTLSNCHASGMDPSPQIVLVFSPDIKLGKIFGDGKDMCATSTTTAYHTWGLSIPNYASVPTSLECTPNFPAFTYSLTHEEIEILTDPGGTGYGDFPNYTNEAADICQNSPVSDPNTVWGPDGLGRIDTFSRYWSNSDNDCEPRLDPPGGSQETTWVLGSGNPLNRFSSGPDTFPLSVPSSRIDTAAIATQVEVVIQTGGDDLHGSSSADVVLNTTGGNFTTPGVNHGNHWDNGQTHSAILNLPSGGVAVNTITGITINTNNSGDDWNVNQVGLVVSWANGVAPTVPPHPIVHRWLDASELPLARLTGSSGTANVPVPPSDAGLVATALNLVISVGNDDLSGGSDPGDNCNVSFTSSPAITPLTNVNGGGTWPGWSIHSVPVPIPSGLTGGDVTGVTLSTAFTNGDNWNVQRVQLFATIDPVSLIQIAINQPVSSPPYDASAILTLNYSATDGDGPGIASVVGSIDGSTTVAGQTVASGLAIPLLTALSLGTHTFSVVATDAWGNSKTSPTVAFDIIVTASGIITGVGQLVGSGQIAPNLQNSLDAKLEAAAAAAARGNCNAADNIYNAFIHEVEAQTGKGITAPAAAILITDVEYLIAHCP